MNNYLSDGNSSFHKKNDIQYKFRKAKHNLLYVFPKPDNSKTSYIDSSHSSRDSSFDSLKNITNYDLFQTKIKKDIKFFIKQQIKNSKHHISKQFKIRLDKDNSLGIRTEEDDICNSYRKGYEQYLKCDKNANKTSRKQKGRTQVYSALSINKQVNKQDLFDAKNSKQKNKKNYNNKYLNLENSFRYKNNTKILSVESRDLSKQKRHFTKLNKLNKETLNTRSANNKSIFLVKQFNQRQTNNKKTKKKSDLNSDLKTLNKQSYQKQRYVSSDLQKLVNYKTIRQKKKY